MKRCVQGLIDLSLSGSRVGGIDEEFRLEGDILGQDLGYRCLRHLFSFLISR